jgi:purine-nucleoside phosphorylase
MSVHIGANKGDIADRILLPGDPLRAQFIAENFLENAVKYNDVRGMLGFTGTYKGERVSVQGTGMGVPSISIYVHELINEFDVKKLIRVGTCGAFQEDVKVRDVILAMSASTDSSTNKNAFHGLDYAPTANFNLLKKAHDVVLQTGKNVHVGNVFTSDLFYDSNENFIPALRKHGSLAVEMETAALYTIAARYNAEALSILTVSDHLLTGELTSSEERQVTFKEMMEIALDTIIEG